MEKPILNLIKKQTKTITDLNKNGMTTIKTFASSISLNRLQNHIQRRYSLNSALRLVTFFNYQGFQNYLLSKIPSPLVSQTNYFFNSKVLPIMIPQDSSISVFHPSLFKSALKMTNPKKITFNCPFKSYEGIQQAAKFGIQTMIVNTPDQIQKIQMTKHKFNYVWEFDEIDLQEAEIIFKLLAEQNLFLSGLRFKEISTNLLPEVQKCIQLGKKLRHNLIQNTYETELNDVLAFNNWKKNSNSSLKLLINDLDTSNFVLCAAKVLGKNRYGKVYHENIEQLLPEQGFRLNTQVNQKEWTLFTPKKLCNLQYLSDEVVEKDFRSD